MVTWITSGVVITLFIGSIALIYYLRVVNKEGYGEPVAIGVMILSTLLFAIVVAAFTRAKRHEVFAAAAA